MAGVDLATLKELMGHSQVSMTMRYVHPTPEHKRQAVNKLEQFNVEHVFALYEKRDGVGLPGFWCQGKREFTSQLLAVKLVLV